MSSICKFWLSIFNINFKCIHFFCRILLIWWSWLRFLTLLRSIIKCFCIWINHTNIWNILVAFADATVATTFDGDLINFTQLNRSDLIINFIGFESGLFSVCQSEFFRDVSWFIIVITALCSRLLRFEIIFDVLANLHGFKLQGQSSSKPRVWIIE